MRKILAAIVAIMFFGVVSLNYGELYAVFYDRFSNEKQSQISEIDFKLMGNSMDQQLIDADGGLTLDENNEASVDVDFDVENTGTCDIYIRLRFFRLFWTRKILKLCTSLTNLLVKFSIVMNMIVVFLMMSIGKNHLMDITITKKF